MYRMESRYHKIETYKINKTSLFCFDYKRYRLDVEFRILSYGHKYICQVNCFVGQIETVNFFNVWSNQHNFLTATFLLRAL